MIFKRFMSLAVSFSASAACSLYSQLRHKMDEHDSGEITEYHVFSSMNTRSPTPIPKAPPDAPSPIINTKTCVLSRDISNMFRAIASP